ncbi:fungal-specific transcription factor domain-containing protein [Aspergillus pseudodeflectus]|uniref:Fungal-specific transcription factor domain-containing protein n=1 Tax=Aspergillus pseudodeflectus TaxID=176178 RepID=A0ABR4KHA3_9EURO
MSLSTPSDIGPAAASGLATQPRREPSTPTSYGSPSDNRRKHSKVSRACDPCKSKKIRCSGTLPCSTCSRRRLSCTYATRYSRGRPPTPPALSSETPGNPADSTSPGQGRIGTRPPEENREEEERRATSELVIEGQYFDLTSGLTFLHRAWSKLSAQRGQLMSHGSNEGARDQPLASAGDRPFYLDRPGVEALPDDATARGLLSLYFGSCVVTYRMLHRQRVEGWLDLVLENRAHGHPLAASLGNAGTSIILTILAIATFRKYKLQSTLSNDLQLAGLHDSDPLFHAATGLTESETGYPRVESVQARLIQVLYLLQTGRMSKAWYTFGNACQIISSLGLHRKQFRQQNAFGEQSDYITQQCAKRVFWTAYTIDKYLSVVFGRPRLLHDVEIDQEFPDTVNDEDMGPDGPLMSDGSDECHITSLICHAKIARIIGRISHEVYHLGDGRHADRAAAADALIHELKAWHAALPPHLGMVKLSTLVASYRREATAITLAYCHALIHATRPFLLGDVNSLSDDPAMQTRINECLSAARKALEIIERIVGDRELSHSFWWTQYVLFCALAVIYVWEIQHKALRDPMPNFDSHEALFDLAEKCRFHLQGAGSAAPPNHRYGLILDELRLEAQRQTVLNGNSRAMSGTGQSAEPGIDDTLSLWADHPMADQTAELDMSTNSIFFSGASMLQTWQSTDWLDLDSSAFDPVLSILDIPP